MEEYTLGIGKWTLKADLVNKDTEDYLLLPDKFGAFSVQNCAWADFHYRTDFSLYEKPSGRIYKDKYGTLPVTITECRDKGCIWTCYTPDSTPIVSIKINSAWNSFTVIKDLTSSAGRLPFEYFGDIFSCAVIMYGGLVIRGALVEHEDHGILITSASQEQISYHTRILRSYINALIINGAQTLIMSSDADTWYGCGMPWCKNTGEYINRTVKLSAIVYIEKGDSEFISVVKDFDALDCILAKVVSPPWDTDAVITSLNTVDNILEDIPVIHMISENKPSSAGNLYKFIKGLC